MFGIMFVLIAYYKVIIFSDFINNFFFFFIFLLDFYNDICYKILFLK